MEQPSVQQQERDKLLNISFIVTGFGPFHGVQTNPTQIVVSQLVDYLKTDAPSSCRYLANSTRTLLFETSAMAVTEELDRLHQELTSFTTESSFSEPRITVLLHLGVNYCGTSFQLERRAYNNATFRVPDEQHYKPQGQCIIDRHSFECCLESLLDVSDLVESMNVTTAASVGRSTNAIQSIDPGRFVCNYAYYYSLERFQTGEVTTGTRVCSFRSLFLHVPPLTVASEAEQLHFVAGLMNNIYQQLVK